MPGLTTHHSNNLVKLLLMADSGAGKTGSLASLVKAGYKFFIIDYDNGLDYLANLLKAECQDKLENIYFKTFTDKLKALNGKMIPSGVPRAFSDSTQALTKWIEHGPDGEKIDMGSPSTWGDDTFLVIDSMTLMGITALRHVLAINGRSAAQPFQSDWGEAMGLMESILQLLYSDSITCNVIVTSHITIVEDDSGAAIKAYPSALGRKLPPKIGRYFNAVLSIERRGSGRAEKRVIRTKSKGILELKAASPTVKEEYPIKTGLADYVKDVLGAQG